MDDNKPEGAFDEPSAKKKIDSIFEPVKKPMNARKFKGANGAMTKQLLLAALQKKGFILVTGDAYIVDLSGRIEKEFGDDGVKNNTSKDVRVILETLVLGLKSQGKKVREIYETKKHSGKETKTAYEEVPDERRIRDDDELSGEDSAPGEVEG